MFGLYLILVGVERFIVELIKVNYKYDWGFVHPTQAEILSVVLVITGIGVVVVFIGIRSTIGQFRQFDNSTIIPVRETASWVARHRPSRRRRGTGAGRCCLRRELADCGGL